MPYIVFAPVAPVQFAMGTTPGALTIPSYNLELNKIGFEINALQFQFSGLAAASDVGGVAASLSVIAINSSIIAENVADIQLEVKKLNLSISGVSSSIDTSTKGLANISTHMGKQTVIATAALNDQVATSEFQKQVTNEAQVAAGIKPTVVTPADFVERVKKTVADVSITNAVLAATSLVQEAISNTATIAFTTTATWIAESTVGVFIQEAYGKLEVAVIGLFSEAKAKVAADKIQARLGKLRAGAKA